MSSGTTSANESFRTTDIMPMVHENCCLSQKCLHVFIPKSFKLSPFAGARVCIPTNGKTFSAQAFQDVTCYTSLMRNRMPLEDRKIGTRQMVPIQSGVAVDDRHPHNKSNDDAKGKSKGKDKWIALGSFRDLLYNISEKWLFHNSDPREWQGGKSALDAWSLAHYEYLLNHPINLTTLSRKLCYDNFKTSLPHTICHTTTKANDSKTKARTTRHKFPTSSHSSTSSSSSSPLSSSSSSSSSSPSPDSSDSSSASSSVSPAKVDSVAITKGNVSEGQLFPLSKDLESSVLLKQSSRPNYKSSSSASSSQSNSSVSSVTKQVKRLRFSDEDSSLTMITKDKANDSKSEIATTPVSSKPGTRTKTKPIKTSKHVNSSSSSPKQNHSSSIEPLSASISATGSSRLARLPNSNLDKTQLRFKSVKARKPTQKPSQSGSSKTDKSFLSKPSGIISSQQDPSHETQTDHDLVKDKSVKLDRTQPKHDKTTRSQSKLKIKENLNTKVNNLDEKYGLSKTSNSSSSSLSSSSSSSLSSSSLLSSTSGKAKKTASLSSSHGKSGLQTKNGKSHPFFTDVKLSKQVKPLPVTSFIPTYNYAGDLEITTSTIAGAGKGVFTRRKLKKNEIVGRYMGKIIGRDELLKMKKKDSNKVISLMLPNDREVLIDGGQTHHYSSFFNHKWQTENHPLGAANLTVTADGCFECLRPIALGEELFFDYGAGYWIFHFFGIDTNEVQDTRKRLSLMQQVYEQLPN